MYHHTNIEDKGLLVEELFEKIKDKEEIVIVCVGTDRSTGDALGPLVGEMLGKEKFNDSFIYGNLQFPVHAKNLEETKLKIEEKHPKAFVVAVDAALGRKTSIGHVYMVNKPLKPGAGVKKELPSIGDIHISGTVNIAGFMEHAVLQSTRLFEVFKMSEYITDVIKDAIKMKEKEEAKTLN